MSKFITLLIACFSSTLLFGTSGHVAKTNGIETWYETFGEKGDPAFLLVAGGLCQGIMWPTEFCEALANKGLYVIRYDHRDSGLSTCFDFEEDPYDLLNMAIDAVDLLDYLQIDKAHVCGHSMGGPITELMSVYFPKRVMTMTLLATSCDLRPCSLADDGFYPSDITLSRPKEVYANWMQKFLKFPPVTLHDQLEARLEAWRILNGSVAPFEEKRSREIHAEFLSRLKHPKSYTNHLLAIKHSFGMIQEVPSRVKVPTLVIQGSEDPILPPDHGEALHEAIANSRYLFINGMGHVLNSQFYDLIIEEIKQLIDE